jgi:DeoR family transcriptional regulator, fructose operon transcriptional repressor
MIHNRANFAHTSLWQTDPGNAKQPIMHSSKRQLQIKELFAASEFLDSNELCRKLSASRSSLRRDLIELERLGLLRRVHGGAISLRTRDDVLDFNKLAVSCHEEKARIGRLAANLIDDGQTIILGGGSTAVEVARNLVSRSVQVITNSIPVAQVFWDCKQVEVTLTGGYLYPRLGIQLGPICERMLHGVAADALVMGIRGITALGLSDSNTLIVGSIRKMIEASRKVIVVADRTKFGRDGMVHVADLKELDVVVSDSGLAPEYQELLKDNGLTCILA